MRTITDLLCHIIRRERIDWPAALGALEVFETAEQHGVHLLAARRLCAPDAAGWCPPEVHAYFESALRGEVATELITRRELREAIAALRAEGVCGLLFKGAAVAFTHYDDPALRPRVDVDVLIKADEVQTAARVLERLGYRASLSVTGELANPAVPTKDVERCLVSSQILYSKTDRYGVQHLIDVHWKLSIPQVFANLMPFDELAADSVQMPALGEAARSIGAAQALAIACIHRVAHHRNNERLIWIYDIHLLAGALDAAAAGVFLDLVEKNRISAICAEGLTRAGELFGAAQTSGLLRHLQVIVDRNGYEASAVYLRRDLRKVDVLVSDLAALESWRERLRLVAQHVLPPAGYVRKRYGVSRRALVPALYAWRFVDGSLEWFRRGRPPSR